MLRDEDNNDGAASSGALALRANPERAKRAKAYVEDDDDEEGDDEDDE